MSLKELFSGTLWRINGSQWVRHELMTHVDRQRAELVAHAKGQTADLVAHANRQTADLVACLHGVRGVHEGLDEILGILARSHRELLGVDNLIVEVVTEKPVAQDSPDHVAPWGTKQDNSTNLPFNCKLARWIRPASLRVLDLGRAGGGFVKSVLDIGCLAVGIEGSDYSKIRARAEWATIPHRLFTADITEPFQVTAGRPGEAKTPLRFSVITAWEVIEHIRAKQLSAVFRNFDAHLEPNGVVIMSVSPRADVVDGVVYHQTVEGRDWWLDQCGQNGFVHHDSAVCYFGEDWVRGEVNAAGSFPLVLTRRGESLPAPLPGRRTETVTAS